MAYLKRVDGHMGTPIRDYILRYAQSGMARLHMPGHKGRGPLGCEAFDITEIYGADSLYEANGIIAESEKNATALFGTQRTLYSAEGSSQCLRAMLQLALRVWREDMGNSRNERPVALAGRNAHRAFLTSAALCDFDVAWLWPEAEIASPCACPITPAGLSHALDEMKLTPFCVFVTSPDYLGGMLDIASIAGVCHARGIPLLVDNAHGAYMKFLPEALHPMELGADMCCDSAHKTLNALTGAAYLHVGVDADPRYAQYAREALALFGSTSPSYLILQSLDMLNEELSSDFPQRLTDCRARLAELKRTLQARGWDVLTTDPMKLTLRTDGFRVASLLRGAGIEPELVEPEHVVMMFSPNNTASEFERVAQVLTCPPHFEPAYPLNFPAPPMAMSIREAMFAPSETVPTALAAGRVCASPPASCPPAVAIVVPGEEITPEAAQALLQCGIREISVVK